MSTLVLTSASGAPGVTTTALGLTLAWPQPCLLVDADRSASQAILAGHLRGEAATAGLEALLQAHRERAPLGEVLQAAQRSLPDAPDRTFVPGFTHLGAVDLFDSAWPTLLAEFALLQPDVIVDAGRTDHRGLPEALVRGADLVAIVCRTSLVGLAGLRLHLTQLLELGPVEGVGLILVGPGRPYAAAEVAAQFQVPVLAQIDWDPGTAEELNSGPLPGKRRQRTPLVSSLNRAAAALHARTRRPAEREAS